MPLGNRYWRWGHGLEEKPHAILAACAMQTPTLTWNEEHPGDNDNCQSDDKRHQCRISTFHKASFATI
jgi:hypothetical protein